MPRNVEIKARTCDLAKVKAIASDLSGSSGQIIDQRDTFFKVSTGRLKLRYLKEEDSQLIFYNRPDQEGPKTSTYSKARTPYPEELEDVLDKTLGIRGKVIKRRFLYLVGQTRVHCDSVEGLGDFVELEVCLRDDQSEEDGIAIANDLMDKLGVAKEDLLSKAYMDLLEEKA